MKWRNGKREGKWQDTKIQRDEIVNNQFAWHYISFESFRWVSNGSQNHWIVSKYCFHCIELMFFALSLSRSASFAPLPCVSLTTIYQVNNCVVISVRLFISWTVPSAVYVHLFLGALFWHRHNLVVCNPLGLFIHYTFLSLFSAEFSRLLLIKR